MPQDLTAAQREIVACAARLIAETGLEYGPAKRRALRQLGLPERTPLPSNDAVELGVREYLDVFCSDTQPAELQRLREIALRWMTLMQEFSPYISGATWHGTATRHSDIHLQLFSDDPKSPELQLIDRHIPYDVGTSTAPNGQQTDTLTVFTSVPEWQQRVLVHMSILDRDDIRGALKRDASGRAPRGDLGALRERLGKS